ncbi:competence protein CoiA [Sinorhizobium fredii]|uniref:competence protein CoiA n=1 Tax=Rhizobium fredii TaxID=380 RepID=UPI0035187A0B
MKFALVEGGRKEATPASRGECPGCGASVIAKCGTKKLWHWAHSSVRNCDRWWEPETAWHRGWKNEFPAPWQEVRCIAPDGELHIADVKTEAGFVLEFQHSNISPIERASRESYYGSMVWLVDGGRLKNDLPKFQTTVQAAPVIDAAPLRLLMHDRANPLVERWAGSRRPVFVDFGESQPELPFIADEQVLWRLQYLEKTNNVVATPVSRSSFIGYFRNGGRLRGYRLPQLRARPTMRSGRRGFENYMQRKEARRRRF